MTTIGSMTIIFLGKMVLSYAFALDYVFVINIKTQSANFILLFYLSVIIWGCFCDHRKQELRELKMLQKQEQKQFQDLTFKAQLSKEQQVCRLTTTMSLLDQPLFAIYGQGIASYTCLLWDILDTHLAYSVLPC